MTILVTGATGTVGRHVVHQLVKRGADVRALVRDPAGGVPGKLLSPARRRVCIDHVRDVLNISERRACRALGQHRSTQRKAPRGRDDDEDLTADLIELAR